MTCSKGKFNFYLPQPWSKTRTILDLKSANNLLWVNIINLRKFYFSYTNLKNYWKSDLLTLPKYSGNFWRIFQKIEEILAHFWKIWRIFANFEHFWRIFGTKAHKSLTYLGRIYRFEIMLVSLLKIDQKQVNRPKSSSNLFFKDP